MTKIVLLEFIDEYESFLRFLRREKLGLGDFSIISLEPVLQAHLKKQGVPYENTLPYFNSDSHRQILVESEKYMQFIRREFSFTDKNGLKKCYLEDYALYLRVFTNHILRLLVIMQNLCRSRSGIELYAFIWDYVSPGPEISKEERYCGVVAKRFADAHGLKFTCLVPDSVQPGIRRKDKPRFLFWGETAFFKLTIRLIKNCRTIIVPQIWGGLNKLVTDLSGQQRDILFVSIGNRNGFVKNFAYNIAKLLQWSIWPKGRRYAELNLKHFNPLLQESGKAELFRQLDILKTDEAKSIFKYYSVCYQDFCVRKLEIALKPYMLDSLCASYALSYIFDNFKRLLVISHAGIGYVGIAAELAGVKGKKSLFVSHGTHPVPVDKYHELELSNLCRTFMLGAFTDIALSTPVQEKHLHYFKERAPDIRNNEVKTGPLIFSSLKGTEKSRLKRELGIPENRIVLTYSVTTKPRQGNRFYFLETLDEFQSSITDIVKVVNELDNVLLILRLHPWYSFLKNEATLKDDDVLALLPKSHKYIINRQGPFAPILGATDILLNYSSTTIDEALINRIPVLLYDKWDRYNHFQSGVFADEKSSDIFPVCYVNKLANLKPALEFMIRKAGLTRKDDINVNKYVYAEDYANNFADFINTALPRMYSQAKG